MYVCVCVCMCVCVRVCICELHVSVCLSVCLSVHLSVCLSVYMCVCVCMRGCVCVHTQTSISARHSSKEPLFVGLFCGKWPVKTRHPMGLSPPLNLCQTLINNIREAYNFSIHTNCCRSLFAKEPLKMHTNCCRSLFAKEPLKIGLFCGNWRINIRHPMHLRHPVVSSTVTLRRW